MKRTVLFILLAFGAGASTGLAEWPLDQDYKFGSHATMISDDRWAARTYTEATLDTLVYISSSEPPGQRIINCVLNGESRHDLIRKWLDFMRETSREAVNNGRHDTTPVEEFFARLEEDCPPEV